MAKNSKIHAKTTKFWPPKNFPGIHTMISSNYTIRIVLYQKLLIFIEEF